MMLTMDNAVVPMIVDIDVIEADVIVIKVVMVSPTPAKRSPPRMAPRSQPFACCKPETEPNPPVVREPHPKPIRAGFAYPVTPHIGRIGITGAVNHDIIRAHLGTQVTRCITRIDLVRRRAIDLRVSYVMERRADRNAVNDRWHIRRDLPWPIGGGGLKPNAIF